MTKLAEMIPIEFYNLKESKRRNHPIAHTVGELISQLQKLPKTLPIQAGFGHGCEIVVYNVNMPDLGGPVLELCEIDE